MKVFWTDRAKSRLKQINQYIAIDSQIIANKTVSRILLRSLQIGHVPYTDREVPEYQHGKIREILERPYRIIYRILEKLRTELMC